MPALRTDDGLLLTDNAAIAAYLEARIPEPPLLGRTPQEKAEIASWNWRVEFEGLLAIAEAMRNSAPTMANRALAGPVDYAQIPELAQRGLARLQQFFVTLNDRLVDRDVVATGRFSIADITALVAVDFARVVKVKPGEQHPHLQRWRAAMGLQGVDRDLEGWAAEPGATGSCELAHGVKGSARSSEGSLGPG